MSEFRVELVLIALSAFFSAVTALLQLANRVARQRQQRWLAEHGAREEAATKTLIVKHEELTEAVNRKG